MASLLAAGSAWRMADSIMVVRRSSSNGFSRKSSAPSFIASTASGTSPWPVMMITGSLRGLAPNRRNSSKPSIPGMRTSVSTQPGSRFASSSRKTCAESKTRTSKPAEPSRKSSESRIAGSSSMTYTLPGIGQILGMRRGQRETERRAAGLIGLGPHPSAVRLDDGAAEGKPDAHAGFLGGEKRLEQVRERISRETGPGVGNRDLDHVIGGLGV